MKIYADTPARRTAQIVADVLFVVWLVAWVWIGNVIHDGTMALAEPGRQTTEAATSLSSGLTDAGDHLREVPLVGDDVAGPFDQAPALPTRWPRPGASKCCRRTAGIRLGTLDRCDPDPGGLGVLPAVAVAVRAAGDSRQEVHRRRRGPRPVCAARAGPPADARARAGSATTPPVPGATATPTSSGSSPGSSSARAAADPGQAQQRPAAPEGSASRKRRAPEALRVEGLVDRGGDGVHLVGRDQRHGRAAEAAAGHPGADRTGADGSVDGDVELGAGDLEVVAHRGVRGGEQVAQRRPVLRPDGLD